MWRKLSPKHHLAEPANVEVLADQIYRDSIGFIRQHPDRDRLIREDLIPQMNQRRARSEPLSSEEVVSRMLSIDPPKVGEALELLDECRKVVSNEWRPYRRLTAAVALEIGDMIYYSRQPNCPDIMADPDPLVFFLTGVSQDIALDFCLLKYLTRMRVGDTDLYKAIEEEVMTRYLDDPANGLVGQVNIHKV